MFFEKINTMEHLRKEYHALAKKHHPDLGGSTEMMKKINSEFQAALERLEKGIEINFDFEAQIKKAIDTLVLFSDLTLEICGSWLWVSGNTKNRKNEIKGLGLFYAASKKMWYLKPSGYRKKSKKHFSIGEIRHLYGSEVVGKKRITA